MFQVLICSFAAIAFLAIVDVWYHRRRNAKYLTDFAEPFHVPFFGTALNFLDAKNSFHTLLKLAYIYGSKVKANMGPLEFAFISDPRVIQTVLTTPTFLQKSSEYNMLRKWLGNGLLTSTGQKWFGDRKFLTPAFHFNNLTQFTTCFNKSSDVLVEKLRNEVDKSSINIYNFVSLCTLDIICDSVMGITINAQNHDNFSYVESVKLMTYIIIKRTCSVWKMVDFLYPFSVEYWQERKALKVLHGLTSSVIDKRREYLLQHQELLTSAKCTSFLDMLLQGTVNGKPLSNKEIQEQVNTFMFEGHDTTASGISFTMYLLANNPDKQEKAYQEILQIIGNDKTAPITQEQLKVMNYLTWVIKEGLRMYPPVPMIARTINEDIEIDGTLYPKGLHVVLPIGFLHRLCFDRPEEFIPERFSSQVETYGYIPFSAGFRNCIGQKFAMLEMKAILAKILRNFVLLNDPNYFPELASDVILRCRNGICLRLQERE